MTLRQKLSAVPDGHWLMFQDCPPVHHMMTGIERAGVRQDGLVRAHYSDGTIQEKPASDSILDTEDTSLTLLSLASHFTP